METLAACISEMAKVISFKFGMWTPLAGRQLCSNSGSNRIRDHRNTKMQKFAFFSSCQIYPRWGAPASWAAQHTIMCLDIAAQNSPELSLLKCNH